MSTDPEKVLLVEDDSAHVELIRRGFEDAGLPLLLQVARTLEEARAQLAAQNPALVVADWRLPDGSGLDLVQGLGEEGPPALVLTGQGDERTAVAAMKAGAIDYVVKSEQTLSELPRLAQRALREWGHITERRRLEAQLQHRQRLEAIGRLAGGVAHDFNNLLTGIGLTLGLLERCQPGSEEWREHLAEIRFAKESGAALTKQLLAFSRQQVLKPERVALGRVVREIEPMLQRVVEPIELRIEAEVGAGEVRADPVQIQQIVVNLVTNARDALPGGGHVEVRTSGVDLERSLLKGLQEVPPGSYELLEVRDEGHGIDAEILERVFEPFFTTKAQGQGTGLGLATVFGIVRQSNGYIALESTPGEGTTVSVFLPRVEAAASATS